jgi:hypothetical protein
MTKNAFAIVHFGSNPVYLELELYFFIMLRKYTKNDILYLYSVNDTPPSFVEAVRPLVDEVIPYDDKGITFDVNFESGYSSFNTLRTCNFIFAYTLEKYEKVCIIESDMVIMGNMDSVFKLNSPAVLTYYLGLKGQEKQLKTNVRVENKAEEVIAKCNEMGRTNGGVMLIEPSMRLFETYKDKIQDVVKHTCKYPNETLFEYVNHSYFNMPIQYNLSHFLAKPHIVAKYGLTKDEILVFHFNETKFKHIDIIKNPVDDSGINWLENPDPKYAIKKMAVLHYKDTVYDKNRKMISKLLLTEEEKQEKQEILKWNREMDKKEKQKEKQEILKWNREMDKKEKQEEKWMTRLDDLIERIQKLNTRKSLVKFNEDYIEPIVKITNSQKMNHSIQSKVKVLTDLYDTKMEENKQMLQWNREMDKADKPSFSLRPPSPSFSPHTPPFAPPSFSPHTPPFAPPSFSPHTPPFAPSSFSPHTPPFAPPSAYPPAPPSASPPSALKKKRNVTLKVKPCKEGEEINPATNRCRKVCPPGKTRNEKGVCVKSVTKATKKCKEGEEINPATNRCRKVCPPGKIRNEKGVCVTPK